MKFSLAFGLGSSLVALAIPVLAAPVPIAQANGAALGGVSSLQYTHEFALISLKLLGPQQ
jgi:hypothetical protein